MKQTEIEWLTDPDHVFESVRHTTNRDKDSRQKMKDSILESNEAWAKSLGYKDYNHMLTHNNKKYHEEKLKYGDRVINGWL